MNDEATNDEMTKNEAQFEPFQPNGAFDLVGVWIPDAAIIEAERRRREEIARQERPFLEVPLHPVLEECPDAPEPAPGGNVIILDI